MPMIEATVGEINLSLSCQSERVNVAELYLDLENLVELDGET